MPEIPFTTDGFVDMDAFDAIDPDSVAALDELGLPVEADIAPELGDTSWHDLLDGVFEGSIDPGFDVDLLLDSSEPFDIGLDKSPFDLDEYDDLDAFGGTDDDSLLETDELRDSVAGSDEGADDDDLEIEIDPIDEVEVDEPGSGVGDLVDFGSDDLGSGVGDLVDFDETDDGLGIDDDLDALENTDFDH